MQIQWDWINDAEPFDLPSLPIAGRRELVKREKEQAEVLAEYSLANYHQRCAIFLAVKKVVDARGVTEAKKIWDNEARHYFSERAAEDLLWEEGEWEENFDAWLDKEVLVKLGVKDHKEALERVQEALRDVKWDKLSNVLMDHRMESFVANLHWRLKKKFDTITIRGEGEVKLTRENLEKVLDWPEDEAKIREAERKPSEKVDWEEEMGHKTEEAIRKN